LSDRGFISGRILREWSNFVGKITETPPLPLFDMLKPLHRNNSYLEQRMSKITVVSGHINISALNNINSQPDATIAILLIISLSWSPAGSIFGALYHKLQAVNTD